MDYGALMSFPTLRPEFWSEQERQQRARDARLGRTGTAPLDYCAGASRLRFWFAVIFTCWLTYVLRKIDVDGLWLLVGILVVTPLLVVAIGEWLKCWYERQIESSPRQADTARDDAAEEARKERMRAEMAQSIMSELRSVEGSQAEPPQESAYMGKAILKGEVLGEIVLVRDGADCAVAYAFPLPAAERRERVPTGEVIESGDWKLGILR